MQLKNGQTIVFIGDSITDCGRRGPDYPLGNGYVKLFTDLLLIRHPKLAVHVINKGIGGDNVVGLNNRWQDDVLFHRPDWLSVKIGINDLHSHLGQGSQGGIHPKLYREMYESILSRTRKALPKCRILLIDPFYVSTDAAPMSQRAQVLKLLPRYIETVHAMSRKYGTRLVQTHAMFQNLLKTYEADRFGSEPVHPYLVGHLAIAEAVYNALR